MKLYYFIPTKWFKGMDYPVIADSLENALENLKHHLKTRSNENKYWLEQYNKWENATIENIPESYMVKESDVIMPME